VLQCVAVFQHQDVSLVLLSVAMKYPRKTPVLQCVAVCCSVLQCVAVCCSVLQCVAVCCSVLLSRSVSSFTGCSDEIPMNYTCDAVTCCSVLQCIAVCCSVLQCVE